MTTSLEEYEKISYITQGTSEIKTCSKTSKETTHSETTFLLKSLAGSK